MAAVASYEEAGPDGKELADPALAGTPTERLEHEITSLAASLAAATCRFVLLVADLDRRRAWASWGCRSMADWLSWRCGIGLVAAREQVRVGRALAELPGIRAALGAGSISYSKARALVRVATPASEEELLGLAAHASAAQLELIVRAYARVAAAHAPDAARRRLARRGLWIRRGDDGMATITARVPDDVADLVERALNEAVEHLPTPHTGPAEPTPEWATDPTVTTVPARHRADALEAVCRTFLEPDPDRAPRTTVTIEIDLADLTPEDTTDPTAPPTGAGNPASVDVRRLLTRSVLPRPTLERYLCDTAIRRMITNAGVPLQLGQRVRTATASQRAALVRRDGPCCRFLGCGTTQHLHVHHLHHWTRGGPTDLDNLFLVCPHHHRLLHDGGWTATGTPTTRLTFHAPDSRTLDATPPTNVSPEPLPTADAPRPASSDRLDLDLTITGLVSLLRLEDPTSPN